jgi:hypothetical protein
VECPARFPVDRDFLQPPVECLRCLAENNDNIRFEIITKSTTLPQVAKRDGGDVGDLGDLCLGISPASRISLENEL